MGLDQSLYREVQLEGKMEITDKKLDKVLGGKKMRPSVRHEVCYWRKFNALHKYFNDHFNEQDNDNCVNMYMSIDDIKGLLKLVKKIRGAVKMDGERIANPEVCEELPTQEGFFFGSTDYDKLYVADLDSTIEQLGKVINEHEKLIKAGVAEYDIDYYYRAWY